MGQCHQIYAHIKSLRDDTDTIGLHHQWLFGQMAVHLLANVFRFTQNTERLINPFYHEDNVIASNALQSLYSLDLNLGHFHMVHPLWMKDPEHESVSPRSIVGFSDICCQDPVQESFGNHNGITIIDFTLPQPSYCFMSIGRLECLHDTQKKNYEPLVPMSAEYYLMLHYPDFRTRTYNGRALKLMKICQDAIATLSEYEVLTPMDIKRIFPRMNEKEKIKFIDHSSFNGNGRISSFL